MSHITAVKTEFNSLETLEAAFGELGMVVERGRERFKWFGRFVGDTAGLPGVPVSDYNKCSHVARLKDAESGDYEIGLIENADGTVECRFDTWQQARLMAAVGGPQLKHLKKEYALQVATGGAYALARAGYTMRREVVGNRTRVWLTKR